MSDSRDSGPLAPRRSLGKSPSTDVPTEPMTAPEQQTGATPQSGYAPSRPHPPPYAAQPTSPQYPRQQPPPGPQGPPDRPQGPPDGPQGRPQGQPIQGRPPQEAPDGRPSGQQAQVFAPARGAQSAPPDQQQPFPRAPEPGDRPRQGPPDNRTAPSEPGASAPHTWSGRRPEASPAVAPSGRNRRDDQAAASRSSDRKRERAERRAAASRPRTVRRARLKLTRVDPWSVTKVAFLLSIAFGIMCVVAVFLVFSILSAAGLWDHINETVQGVLNQDANDAFDIKDYVGMTRVMGLTTLIAVVDVVLITALATLGAFLYNMAASLLGGVEVTLAEDVR